MSRSHRLGLTRTQAVSATNRGYGFHAMLPVNRARPTLPDTDYIATPVRDEDVMLYSFSDRNAYLKFLEDFRAEALPA